MYVMVIDNISETVVFLEDQDARCSNPLDILAEVAEQTKEAEGESCLFQRIAEALEEAHKAHEECCLEAGAGRCPPSEFGGCSVFLGGGKGERSVGSSIAGVVNDVADNVKDADVRRCPTGSKGGSSVSGGQVWML